MGDGINCDCSNLGWMDGLSRVIKIQASSYLAWDTGVNAACPMDMGEGA